MTIELNVYHTIAIAIVILIAGEAIRNRVMVLQKYCIPVPVVGGLLCTVIILIGHETAAVLFRNWFYSKLEAAEEGRAASNYIPDYFLCRGCIPEPAWSGAIKADGD